MVNGCRPNLCPLGFLCQNIFSPFWLSNVFTTRNWFRPFFLAVVAILPWTWTPIVRMMDTLANFVHHLYVLSEAYDQHSLTFYRLYLHYYRSSNALAMCPTSFFFRSTRESWRACKVHYGLAEGNEKNLYCLQPGDCWTSTPSWTNVNCYFAFRSFLDA